MAQGALSRHSDQKVRRMNVHKNERIVRFRHPFRLDSVDEDFPAGNYFVQTQIETLGENALRSFRTLSTKLVVTPGTAGQSEPRMIDIDPLALQRAFANDNRRPSVRVRPGAEAAAV